MIVARPRHRFPERSLAPLSCLFLGYLLVSCVLSDRVASTATADDDPARLATVRKILRDVPLIDGHNDTPWQYRTRVHNDLSRIDLRSDTKSLSPTMHTDLARLRAGGVGGQFWSVYVPVSLPGAEAVQAVVEQIEVVYELAEIYPDAFEMAFTAGDVERIHEAGKIASIIGMEGGHSINNSLITLRALYRLGARYMTITHSKNTDWADSSTDDPVHDGLSPFGVEVIREMNRLGMIVDLSHVSAKSMHDVLDASVAPVVFSHSSARAITGHPRNVPDDVLARLPENGGIVMVTFVPGFVSEAVREYYALESAEEERLQSLHPGDPIARKSALGAWRDAHPKPRATLEQVADHFDHLIEKVGADHVGIGGDFDGITSTVKDLDDVSRYPHLLAELLRRGHSEGDLRKIAGLNALRVFRGVEATAAKLREARGPSYARFEESPGD